MSAERKKMDLRTKLFGAAAVLLVLILIGEAVLFFNRISLKREYSTLTANTILHQLNRGAYTDALYSVRYNRAAGLTEELEPAFALPYAAADYYEAASYCLAFERAGRDEEAKAYRAKMEEAYQRMGELQFLAEKINAGLGFDE